MRAGHQVWLQRPVSLVFPLLPDAGNPNVLVCERGTMFGYSDLIVDPRNFVAMRDAGCPITADVTHALQQVGQVCGKGGTGS